MQQVPQSRKASISTLFSFFLQFLHCCLCLFCYSACVGLSVSLSLFVCLSVGKASPCAFLSCFCPRLFALLSLSLLLLCFCQPVCFSVCFWLTVCLTISSSCPLSLSLFKLKKKMMWVMDMIKGLLFSPLV